MAEKWVAVPNTDGAIEVSSLGRVRSSLRERGTILKSQIDKKGYRRVSVTINRHKKTYKVHRLVAFAFVQNPHGFPQVNHIDGDKNNNSAINLEWCNNQQNAAHAIRTGLWDSVIAGAKKENDGRKKPVLATDIFTGDTTLYDSVSAAKHAIGTRHVVAVIKGERSQSLGYRFRYAGGDACAAVDNIATKPKTGAVFRVA